MYQFHAVSDSGQSHDVLHPLLQGGGARQERVRQLLHQLVAQVPLGCALRGLEHISSVVYTVCALRGLEHISSVVYTVCACTGIMLTLTCCCRLSCLVSSIFTSS